MSNYNKKHEKYITRCFELAKRGASVVSPNPLVGSVLVKNNHIIGEGWHQNYGGPHAEVNAIKAAGNAVSGSTLYCNLEPCCHKKKQTPPCVPLIIESNIKKVILSNIDPNAAVSGQGVEQLRKAGIEVETGVLDLAGAELNRYYFTYIKQQRPYIVIKIAQSLDGKISLDRSGQTWISGKSASNYVHQLRAGMDAVLVGAGTVKSDDPELTVRHVSGRNPVRIILDGQLTSPENARIFDTSIGQTWLLVADDPKGEKSKQLKMQGVKIFNLDSQNRSRINSEKIVELLYRQKINSLLIEGGQDVFGFFINSNIFDEIILIQSPVLFGKGVDAFKLKAQQNLQLIETRVLEDDVLIRLRKNVV